MNPRLGAKNPKIWVPFKEYGFWDHFGDWGVLIKGSGFLTRLTASTELCPESFDLGTLDLVVDYFIRFFIFQTVLHTPAQRGYLNFFWTNYSGGYRAMQIRVVARGPSACLAIRVFRGSLNLRQIEST